MLFTTTTSSDHFQLYVPAYAHFLSKAYPDADILVNLTGGMSSLNSEAVKHLGPKVTIKENTCPNLPQLPSSVNLLRFLVPPGGEWDYCIITDADLLLFPGDVSHFEWHKRQMDSIGACYYAHHGPYKYPERFEGGWHGRRERQAGGFVLVTREWVERTSNIREALLLLLMQGKLGTYREEDEVTLCNINKSCGFPIDKNKRFPAELRGIHLGDFKESMTHRWTNIPKMEGKLTDRNIRNYLVSEQIDSTWAGIKGLILKDPTIKAIFSNLNTHIRLRAK